MCDLPSLLTMGSVFWNMNGLRVFFFWQTFVFAGLNGSSKKRAVSSSQKAREHYSLLCHFKFISWTLQIKSYCSFRYYSLLMFNVSGCLLKLSIFFWTKWADMWAICHPGVLLWIAFWLCFLCFLIGAIHSSDDCALVSTHSWQWY